MPDSVSTGGRNDTSVRPSSIRLMGVSGYQKSSGPSIGTVTLAPSSAASLATRLRQSTPPAVKPSSARASSSSLPPPLAKAALPRSRIRGDHRSRDTQVRRRLATSTTTMISVLAVQLSRSRIATTTAATAEPFWPGLSCAVCLARRQNAVETGRSGVIRTRDPLIPNQVRYQAALHSDARGV